MHHDSSEASSAKDDASVKDDASLECQSPSPEPSLNDQKAQRKTWKQRLHTFISDQWFLLSMAIMIPISSQHHLPLANQEMKSTVVSYLCVSIIFLITGCTLDTSVIVRNYKRWQTHIYVQVQCFIVCSAIMFALVSAASTNRVLSEDTLIGLAVLGCMPTTISSNVVMTAQANGNSELTLVETTIGNLIGIFVSPALVLGYTSIPTWYTESLPAINPADITSVFARVAQQFGLSIYLPFFLGQLLRHFFKPTCDLLFKTYKLSKLGSVAILVILWSTYDQAFTTSAFSSLNTETIVFLIFSLIGIWALWFALGFGVSTLLGYERKDVIAITYCVAAKGPAITVPLIDRIWPMVPLEMESGIQVPVAIYQTLQIAFGSLTTAVLRRYVERGEMNKRWEREEGEEGEDGGGVGRKREKA